MSSVAGEFKSFTTPEGVSFPLFIIRFDRNGLCTSPQTRSDLLAATGSGKFTDIFLFSHGWNNDFPTALASYEGFINGYSALRRELGLAAPADYRPLTIGVYWPSASLVFGSEAGPQIAASAAPASNEFAIVDELAAQLPAASRVRLYELSQRQKLSPAEAEELASLLLQINPQDTEELPDVAAAGAKDLVATWKEFQTPTQPAAGGDDFGSVSDEEGPSVGGGPDTAGWLDWLDPRPALRLTTVWMMKDRAGCVGANGVGPLLRDILQYPSPRVHLIGHSYGCKLLLSATCIRPLPRKVHSMLLLQPAVSHLCFANPVPGLGKPGGYVPALQRVVQPILATFSANDFPLTQAFHYAVRRQRDLGEAQIAAGAPPSQFAALGGFGPRSSGEKLIQMRPPGLAYAFDAGARLYGLESTRFIADHGDISNEATWWALCQVAHPSE